MKVFQPKRLKRRNLKKFRLAVSQRSWVRFPFKPEFFQVSSFQPLRLKHLHCDDLHIILPIIYSVCKKWTSLECFFHICAKVLIYSPSILSATLATGTSDYGKQNCILCGSVQKVSILPGHGRSLKIPRRKGVVKAKLLEEKYYMKLNWNFLGVWGCKRKNLPGGGMDIF